MPALNREETEQLRRKIGNMASPLASTVAKLYLAPPGTSAWRDSGVWGAVCIIIDRTPPKSFYIQIYDLMTWELKFAHELYESMQYQQLTPQFQAFEMDHAMAGLSFCDKDDAEAFYGRVKSQIPSPSSGSAATSSQPKKSGKGGFFATLFGRKEQAKVEVGVPTNFVHKQHIGYDPAKGFDCSDIPTQWKEFFKTAGIRKKDLKNADTARVIFETLQTELGSEGGTSVPPMYAGVPEAPSFYSSPDDDTSSVPAAPPMDIPAAPPMGVPAAPPFDAPPLGVPAAPPFEAPPMDAPFDAPPMDAPPARPGPITAAMLKAPELKKTAPAAAADEPEDHLSAIRKGFTLRKVTKPTKDDALPDLSKLSQGETTDLMSTLQRALNSKFAAVRNDFASQPEPQSDDDDDDWD